MFKLIVGSDGRIKEASGDTQDACGYLPFELHGLPVTFLFEAVEPGIQTRLIRAKTVLRGMPVHFFAECHEDGTVCIHGDSPFGDEVDRIQNETERSLFETLAFFAECDDPDLLDHLFRVSSYTRFFAEEYLELDDHRAKKLEVASLTHDVGKGIIPREILYRPSKLSAEQMMLVRSHTTHGKENLAQVTKRYKERQPWLINLETLESAEVIALSHHENWDGTGYPHQLSGNHIPINARIVRVTDSIDAMMHRRSYKSDWSWDVVRRELIRCSGTHYDPDIAGWVLANETRFLEYAHALVLPERRPM
ncbi:MAG: HD domain-containing protein [Alicyclobacillaceae bacterium]|nr:HD domain-containing protein [Alicyclobacillaceae bacterium]